MAGASTSEETREEHSRPRMTKREAPASNRGENRYMQWLADVKRDITDISNQQAFYAISAHLDFLEVSREIVKHV